MKDRQHSMRRRAWDDRGAAIAMVLLVGSVLVLLTGVVVARGVRQAGSTAGDARWEQALHVAEAGMDYAINERNISGSSTGELVPTFASRTEEREWVLEQVADNPVVQTPEGEFAWLVPEYQKVLYSVGYVPSRDAPGRWARVLRRSYKVVNFVAADGLLVGGNASLAANTLIDDPDGSNATVFVNGWVTLGNNVTIDGCLISGETEIPETADCPGSPSAPAWIPTVRVRPYYALAHEALCADGTVRGGPLHASFPDPTPQTPCDPTDPIIIGSQWKFNAPGNSWSGKSSGVEGVVYLYGTNFDGTAGKAPQNLPAYVTLIAERSSRDCGVRAGGHITLGSGSYVVYHSSIAQYRTVLIAEGDIKYRGGSTTVGAVIAAEQVDYRGSPDSWGPVTAADECDSLNSPVSLTELSGGAVIRFSGQVETLLVAGIRPTDWDEL